MLLLASLLLPWHLPLHVAGVPLHLSKLLLLLVQFDCVADSSDYAEAVEVESFLSSQVLSALCVTVFPRTLVGALPSLSCFPFATVASSNMNLMTVLACL